MEPSWPGHRHHGAFPGDAAADPERRRGRRRLARQQGRMGGWCLTEQRKRMGKPMGKHGKTMAKGWKTKGTPWENHRKIENIGTPWENHEKKNMGKL